MKQHLKKPKISLLCFQPRTRSGAGSLDNQERDNYEEGGKLKKGFLHTLKCKLDSTNGGTFSNSAEQVILIFFLFQRALVMSKLVREYKILTTSHPEMSNGQFHCFHYGTPPKGTKTTQTQTLKRLVKINFFRK